jgi:hypothetical protein
MGLTLIGGLGAAVQPGTGPRHFLTPGYAGGTFFADLQDRAVRGPCHIPNDIVLAWV